MCMTRWHMCMTVWHDDVTWQDDMVYSVNECGEWNDRLGGGRKYFDFDWGGGGGRVGGNATPQYL